MNVIYTKHNKDYMEIFIDSGEGFSKCNSIVKEIDLKSNVFEFEIIKIQNIIGIRIDLLNHNCVVKLNGIFVINNTGESKEINFLNTNAEYIFEDSTYVFLNENPQIFISNEFQNFKIIKLMIEFLDFNFDTKKYDFIKRIIEQRKSLEEQLFIKEGLILQQKFELEEMKKEILYKNMIIEEDRSGESFVYVAKVRKNEIKETLEKIKTEFFINQSNFNLNNVKQILETPLSDKEKYIKDLIRVASEESSKYVPISNSNVELTEEDIKLIAFYLPQFHPTPENDEWWGKGFTEWTNVSKAVPQFVGHYQPHLPGELGFYDLRLAEVQKRQIELAKKYGIYGFCFHHYWFGGKRLLETPFNQLLKNSELDFPFCLCWANENWTRRWDGLENEVLIEQSHSPEDDIAFIKDIEMALRDSRYIKINGKPLLIVYRVGLLPNAKETANRWRKYCKSSGIGDLYLIAVQGFGFSDPRKYGFDAAMEFPPNSMQRTTNITDKIKLVNDDFSGVIYSYSDFVKDKGYFVDIDSITFKTVCPSWDNTARKPNCGSIFIGGTPELYKEWLSDVVYYTKRTKEKSERIVFINAWNEWGEGAHLEPDRKYGYAYLQATANVVLDYKKNKSKDKKIIFVSHDAHFHGGEILALNIVKVLKENFKYEVHVILKSSGVLECEFEQYAKVYNMEKEYYNKEKLEILIKSLYYSGIDIAICNTVITGDIVEILAEYKIKTIALIHELPGVIKQYRAEHKAGLISKYAEKIVFPSKFVYDHFSEIVNVEKERTVIAPQGLYKKNKYKDKKEEARYELRKKFNIPEEACIVLGIGYADLRKGIDIFVDVAFTVVDHNPKTYFIWVGNKDERVMNQISEKISKFKLKDRIILIQAQKDISVFYAGADIYLMTSREDPFPSVILDAMNVAIPVVGFQDAGGFTDIVNEDTGSIVSYLNIDKMIEAVEKLLNNEKLRMRKGENAAKVIEEKFNFLEYVYGLLELLGHNYKKVSVILINYNYAQYLESRLQSIFNQTYPLFEVVFLDDKSSDNSLSIAYKFRDIHNIELEIVQDNCNSGSVFKQWEKGISLSKGDYIWICEADDLCDQRFLEENMNNFNVAEVVLSYSQSKQIDKDGKIIAKDYLSYTNDIDEERWGDNYVSEGVDEIIKALVIKNTLPNISAVVFRKYDISEIVDQLSEFKIAGDWFFYVWLMGKGKVAYLSEALNSHRRHSNSVTASEDKELHLSEIIKMQQYITENFDVDKETKKKMYEYREYVKKYFFDINQ